MTGKHYWREIKNDKAHNKIMDLQMNNTKYGTDEQKVELFADHYEDIFSYKDDKFDKKY